MTSIFRLNVNELSQDLLNAIQAAFKDKVVEITVTEACEETDYILSSGKNRASIQQSIEALEKGEGITFTVQELEEKYGLK